MSPQGKKRPTQSGRPIPKDPRSESASPPRDPASMRPVARISALESELARVQQEREAEADDLAAMLVRIAETERAKATATRAAGELDELANALRVELRDVQARELSNASEWANERATTQLRLQEAEHALAESKVISEGLRVESSEAERKLQAVQGQLAQAEDAVRRAVGRAGVAERSAVDGAASLQRAHAELEGERARAVALEAKQADALREQERKHAEDRAALEKTHGSAIVALKKESDEALNALEQRHAHTLSAMREEHAATRRSSARVLEEERLATTRARRQATNLEVTLASMRAIVEQASELLDELERREEMASAHRARTLEQTRRALAGGACEPATADPPPPVAQPIAGSGAGALDEMEIDLIE
jgi:hypothetical protein